MARSPSWRAESGAVPMPQDTIRNMRTPVDGVFVVAEDGSLLMRQVSGRTTVALLSATLGIIAVAAAVRRWRRLKQVPAVTAETRFAGLKGEWTPVGPYRMFARVSAHPAEQSGRLP